jgi:hypothetical protein
VVFLLVEPMLLLVRPAVVASQRFGPVNILLSCRTGATVFRFTHLYRKLTIAGHAANLLSHARNYIHKRSMSKYGLRYCGRTPRYLDFFIAAAASWARVPESEPARP